MRDKLKQSTKVELSLFLTFNRIKSILGANVGSDDENISLLRQAVDKSKILKLSKDGKTVKRRVQFDEKAVDRSKIDEATIYIENFPEHLTHRELARLFARAGPIRNVIMPKFKDNFTSKGFAFIEFATQKDALNAIELFNNCIPSEFTDNTCQNFVHVQGTVTQLRVMLKHEWSLKKEEMKQLKREIANLCPATMFPVA